jgi:UDP-N-acetylmuramate: L-alanyl-gamma-D-glutamyl-meso-diaminopimelate ligase
VGIHILGICGTFMGGIAQLARQLDVAVSGSDEHVYPPMSTQLNRAGIELHTGYRPAHLDPAPDCVVVGNVMSRGNPVVEAMLDREIPYTSGPQWLGDHVLRGRRVLAVAGTHGKTTTASMLAWILECEGGSPGFLIGGVPLNFGVSARLGEGPHFVVEADEYDTAFFDKRSKFVHYRPRTLILNNLEFDHADIFKDLDEIKRQFHHLIRTVPGQGRIIVNGDDPNLAATLGMGCWTPWERFAAEGEWEARLLSADGSHFRVLWAGETVAEIRWTQLGQHSVANALAAIAAARHAGIPPARSGAALGRFEGVKRRLELWGRYDGISVYDDFAHHPTAIRTTLQGLRARVGGARLVAVLEPRSNTMRMGVHKGALADALTAADRVFLYRPGDIQWSLAEVQDRLGGRGTVIDTVPELVECLDRELVTGDHVVIMSNGGFDGLQARLAERLGSRAGPG